MNYEAFKMKESYKKIASELPVETKKIFYRAFFREQMNVGDARQKAGIDDILVAAELMFQLHVTVSIPMKEEDIT